MSQPPLITVSIFRRSYGRRYTDLPVDRVDDHGFLINCDDTYMRPAGYDLCPGDIVRWRQAGGYLEAVISAVHRDDRSLQADFAATHPLPPEFFPY